MVKITAFYTAIMAILFLLLSIQVIANRQRLRISLGDGGEEKLIRVIRAHANFSEYVPFILISLLTMELNGVSILFLHLVGALMVVGRTIHAYNISKTEELIKLRIVGMVLTFTTLILSAIGLLATTL
jgi:uncharacterized protein